MKIVFQKTERQHPAILRMHKALAMLRKSHSISAVEYGYFDEVRGVPTAAPAIILDIHEPVEEDWLVETVKGLDMDGSEAEFVRIYMANEILTIPLKGWSFSMEAKGEDNV